MSILGPGGQPYGPNRQVRRQVLRELARPAHDLICTKLGPGHIYIGLKGSGYVRLDHHKARQLLDELTRLLDEVSAEGVDPGPPVTPDDLSPGQL